MKNNQIVESSAPQTEAQNTGLSSEVRVEPTSPPDAVDTTTPNQTNLPDELIELIGREIDRRFQSAKDKRWAQLERQYGDLHELNQQHAPALPQQPASEGQSELADKLMERAEALLKRLGLGDTPEAAALLHDQKLLEAPGGFLELLDRVLDLAVRDVAEEDHRAPTPAGVIAPGGGQVASEDLTAAYRQRKKRIRPGDVNALTALKREFREKGLKIF